MTTSIKSTETAIPSREEAITNLVELDVAKWGESERAASQAARCQYSHGLAVNALAHYDLANIDHRLAKAARQLFTAADKRALRSGG
jgi:hypothetical protein